MTGNNTVDKAAQPLKTQIAYSDTAENKIFG